jgi:hypothetical protein
MDFRESDCNGKGLCEDCKWWNHVSGEYRDGKCSSWSGWPTLKCTDTCRS